MHTTGPGEVGQALKTTWNTTLQQFTENKQVNVLSIQVCQGINADQCLEHFCAKDRTSLHCQKVREILDMGELTYNAKKTMLSIAAANQSACFSFSAVNYSQNCTKALNKVCSTWNQMILVTIASSDCWVHVSLSYSPCYKHATEMTETMVEITQTFFQWS